jgi:hypothetical protein
MPHNKQGKEDHHDNTQPSQQTTHFPISVSGSLLKLNKLTGFSEEHPQSLWKSSPQTPTRLTHNRKDFQQIPDLSLYQPA